MVNLILTFLQRSYKIQSVLPKILVFFTWTEAGTAVPTAQNSAQNLKPENVRCGRKRRGVFRRKDFGQEVSPARSPKHARTCRRTHAL